MRSKLITELALFFGEKFDEISERENLSPNEAHELFATITMTLIVKFIDFTGHVNGYNQEEMEQLLQDTLNEIRTLFITNNVKPSAQ
jgi:hypothetical protein